MALTEAERGLRRLIETDVRRPAQPHEQTPTVDEVATALRERREIEGIRPSARRNLESMQRVYIQPLLGKRPIDAVRQSDVERLGRRMLAQQLAPKTVRNLMTVLSSVFALAIDDGWISSNPVHASGASETAPPPRFGSRYATQRCARMRPIDRRAAASRGSGRLRRAWSDARPGRATNVGRRAAATRASSGMRSPRRWRRCRRSSRGADRLGHETPVVS
jgi:integrase-like protein